MEVTTKQPQPLIYPNNSTLAKTEVLLGHQVVPKPVEGTHLPPELTA